RSTRAGGSVSSTRSAATGSTSGGASASASTPTPRRCALPNGIATTAPFPTSSPISYVDGRASVRAATIGETEGRRGTGSERSRGPGRSSLPGLQLPGADDCILDRIGVPLVEVRDDHHVLGEPFRHGERLGKRVEQEVPELEGRPDHDVALVELPHHETA